MPIHVLYLHGFRRFGGAERALLSLADAIRKMAVEPLVAWPRKDKGLAWLHSQGIRAAAVRIPAWRHGLSLPLLPLFLVRLRVLALAGEVDLVDVNNYRLAPFGRAVSRWIGVPCVCHVREVINSKKIRQYRVRSPDALIAVSEAVGETLLHGGIPPDRVMIIRSGVALSAPPVGDGSVMRERLGLSPQDILLGVVAHIQPHKGYEDLVRALALIREIHPRVKCLIVGEAPRKRYLQRLLDLADRLSVRDRLILVGFQDDVAPWLRAMDLFVLPSRTEGFPISILEAMAAGRPVVATTAGGIPEVVCDGETGLLVPPQDPRRLAEAVTGLVEAPWLARSMGENGQKRVEALFTMEAEARQTSTVYRQVLAAYSPRSAEGGGR